eukprot:CAMPEP_0182417422 /NCGR_PEP_ID=MMETSP1167-20130531/1900_1 /TAXON_ID=2988 /ORGANISM="Mallomonas Sp, Strain CCMP3275" /LENGTH=172 /DNA_ID=CAMNT_0024590989 /DNA_START=80 /DNA_END=601 /DNA_ORIENTATION=+
MMLCTTVILILIAKVESYPKRLPLEVVAKYPFSDKNGNTIIAKKSLNSMQNSFDDAADQINIMFENDVLKKIGYGFVMGYASGICLKKVSQVAAAVIGGVFVTVQVLAHFGYINVDHNKLENDFQGIFDSNRDGKFDGTDFENLAKKVYSIASYHMPTGGGFGAGFFTGFRS